MPVFTCIIPLLHHGVETEIDSPRCLTRTRPPQGDSMKTNRKTLEKVWSKVNEKELVALAMALVDSHSPTGKEEEVVRLSVDWLNERDIPAFYQEVEPGRGNVVGRLKGSGDGPILMFNCHLDTALSGDPTDAMFAGPLRPEWKSEARRKGGLIFGSGIFNDK